MVPPEKDSANLQGRAPFSFVRVLSNEGHYSRPPDKFAQACQCWGEISANATDLQMQLSAKWGYANRAGGGGGGGGENKEQKLIDQGQLQSLLQLCA